MTPLAAALWLGGALEVTAPPGCLAPIEVSAALDEVGGIDVAESVSVIVTPRLDEYALVVEIALAGVPPLRRDVPLRPRECQDVADLVAVLVQGQRRAALEAKLLEERATQAAPQSAGDDEQTRSSTDSGFAIDPRTRPTAQLPEEQPGLSESWSPFDGPFPAGGFRLGAGFGGVFPLGARATVETGFDLSPSATVIAVGEATVNDDDVTRGGGSAGLAWRMLVFDRAVELSARALLGAGGGQSSKGVSSVRQSDCPADSDGGSTAPVEDPHRSAESPITTWYIAPNVAVRARFGYVFVEAGTLWHVNLDDTPAAYFAVGFAPIGP